MGSDSPDRLLVHLNLDRCHDVFLNTLLWNGHSYGLPSDMYVFTRVGFNIILYLFCFSVKVGLVAPVSVLSRTKVKI